MQTFRAAAGLSEGHPQLPCVTAAAWCHLPLPLHVPAARPEMAPLTERASGLQIRWDVVALACLQTQAWATKAAR